MDHHRHIVHAKKKIPQTHETGCKYFLLNLRLNLLNSHLKCLNKYIKVVSLLNEDKSFPDFPDEFMAMSME